MQAMRAQIEPRIPASRELEGTGIAEFFARRGRKVVEGCGALWHSVEGRLLVSLPHQLRLDPDGQQIRGMLWKTAMTGVRYPTVAGFGQLGGIYVNTNKRFDFSHLDRSFRARVRRGFEQCEMRPVEPAELLSQGLELNLDTMKRQDRFDPEFGVEQQWKRLVEAIYHSPAIHAVGSFVQGRLAAYAITCREDRWLHILHRMSRTADLHYCPNHVLDFTLAREIAADPALDAVSMGYVALVPKPGLHEYKIRLRYTVWPHHSVIQFHPALAPVLTSRLMEALVGAAQRWRARDQRWQRIFAVLAGAQLSRPQARMPVPPFA